MTFNYKSDLHFMVIYKIRRKGGKNNFPEFQHTPGGKASLAALRLVQRVAPRWLLQSGSVQWWL